MSLDLAALERQSRPARDDRPRHPAWERYQHHNGNWQRYNHLASLEHRKMQDAADELVNAGEMEGDSY